MSLPHSSLRTQMQLLTFRVSSLGFLSTSSGSSSSLGEKDYIGVTTGVFETSINVLLGRLGFVFGLALACCFAIVGHYLLVLSAQFFVSFFLVPPK
jgi:hypothetical protein